MIWKHTFVVQGTGPFQVDMLRYDRCFPEEEVDSIVIEQSTVETESIVTLVHNGPNKRWKPAVKRWRSYGWTVDALVAEKQGEP